MQKKEEENAEKWAAYEFFLGSSTREEVQVLEWQSVDFSLNPRCSRESVGARVNVANPTRILGALSDNAYVQAFMQDILMHDRMLQRFGDSPQGEGFVARTGGRGHSSKCGSKSSNGGNSRFEDNEGCFKCGGSKDHWKRNCLEWKETQKKMKNAKSSGVANVSTCYDTDDELLMEDEVHKGEVKTRDDGENVVGLVATKKMLLTKVIMERTPRRVELDTRVEEDRVLWEYEVRKLDMSALMKRKELVHKSKNKVGVYVGIYRIRVGMRFVYQDMSRIQGSKKVMSKEFGMGDLFSTQEVWMAQV
ncbi:Hypothetical predicted protein [Prunus dulcis]|uniref:Uncharacterized protein n=1 Tax=Prunus dulcis TaxID=3755 RepID=A0A5E4G2B7_PRUDU|nr:Hypothetical predicted protein [Prunus dulcis]